MSFLVIAIIAAIRAVIAPTIAITLKASLVKNGKILITQIYDKTNIFIPPEFITNDTIPFSTDYSSFYYSLGIIVLHCLQETDKNFLSFEEILELYKEYNFYFTISQCLNINPSKRNFIIF